MNNEDLLCSTIIIVGSIGICYANKQKISNLQVKFNISEGVVFDCKFEN